MPSAEKDHYRRKPQSPDAMKVPMLEIPTCHFSFLWTLNHLSYPTKYRNYQNHSFYHAYIYKYTLEKYITSTIQKYILYCKKGEILSLGSRRGKKNLNLHFCTIVRLFFANCSIIICTNGSCIWWAIFSCYHKQRKKSLPLK